MALDLTTITSPLSGEPLRGAIELARRMMLLRWSVGEYLTAIAGNFGVNRPSLGFVDDEFFRACAQVLMADHKTIGRSFWQLLEIALGPHTNLVFETELDAEVGDSYITLGPELNYVGYENWNTTSFTHNEVVRVGGPGTPEARFRYLDTEETRFHFVDMKNGSFASGNTITGLTSGGTVDLTSGVLRHVSEETIPVTDRLPHYGTMIIEPGLGNAETVEFVTVDKFQRRVRLRNNLTLAHAARSTIFIDGGCWDVFETQARRVAIKIICNTKVINRIPGNAYLHGTPHREAKLRANAVAGANTLSFDESVVDGFPSTPFKVLIDPEGVYGDTLQVQVNSVNAATRVFTLSAALPAGFRRVAGTVIRWVQTDVVTGGLTQNALVGATELKSVARYKDPTGLWIIDRGGVNEELVFVTSTTYQRRQVHSDMTPTKTLFAIDHILDNVAEGTFTKWARFWDTTGLLGSEQLANAFWFVGGQQDHLYPQLGTAGVPGFSTAVDLRETYIEIADLTTGEVTWELARATTKAHNIGETIERFTGTNPVIATDADHLPEVTWPPPGTPDGRWPGPYVHNPSERVLGNVKATNSSTILAQAAIETADPNDLRIYPINQQLSVRYDPARALSSIGPYSLTIPGLANPVVLQTKDLHVDDPSVFPDLLQVVGWLTNPLNPTPGYPPRIVVGSEGGFGRDPVYFLGRGQTGTVAENLIFVSGVKLTHAPGTRVSSYHTHLPLNALAGVLAVADGFPQDGGTVILNHTSEKEEVVFYDSIAMETPTRGSLVFDKGWVPTNTHNPFLLSNIDSSVQVGTQVIRTASIGDTQPRKDGYSFSFILSGNTILIRLAYLIEQVRASGVEVVFYDDKDKEINLGALIP